MIAMPIDAMWECWAILTGPITCFIWPTRGPGANQTVRGRCFFLLPGCSPFCTFGAFRAFRTICRTLKRLMISVNPHTCLTYLQYSAICCGVQVHTLRILKIKPIFVIFLKVKQRVKMTQISNSWVDRNAAEFARDKLLHRALQEARASSAKRAEAVYAKLCEYVSVHSITMIHNDVIIRFTTWAIRLDRLPWAENVCVIRRLVQNFLKTCCIART